MKGRKGFTLTELRGVIVISTLLLSIVTPAPCAANDWPCWLGPAHNGISAETGLLKEWPENGPPVLYEVPIGPGYSSPSISDGRMITMHQSDRGQCVIAFDEKSGQRLWETPIDSAFKDGAGDGPRSTPVIDGDRVYALSSMGQFACLSVTDGKILWSYDTVKEFGIKIMRHKFAVAPLIYNEKLILSVGKSEGNSIIAFNKMNGDIIWRSQNDAAGYSCPKIMRVGDHTMLIIFTGDALVALKPDSGELIARRPWVTRQSANVCTPPIRGNTIFITSGYGVGCALLEINPETTPSSFKDVYVSKAMGSMFSSPILYKDHLYGFDSRFLICMEYQTGEVQWSKVEDFGKGNLVLVDELAYILGENGMLALAELSPKGFKPISKVQLDIETKNRWTMPVVANGRLYIRGLDKLICMNVSAISKQ